MSVQDIFNAVVDMKKDELPGLVQAEIDTGTELSEILNSGLIAAMDNVGALFSDGEIFVPEMLLAANTMKSGLDIIKPLIAKTSSSSIGTVVIGTVKGDLHDIGKNMVAMMMEGAGFDIIDLGIDVEAQKFIDVCNENKADIVALSALLTTTLPVMQATVQAIKEAGLKIPVLVGGAPVTQSFANEIQADGFAEDAPKAAAVAKRLIQ